MRHLHSLSAIRYYKVSVTLWNLRSTIYHSTTTSILVQKSYSYNLSEIKNGQFHVLSHYIYTEIRYIRM